MTKRKDEAFFVAREGEQIAKLRNLLERDGMIQRSSPERSELSSTSVERSPVDVRPEIAAAFAWTKFQASKQKQVRSSQSAPFNVEKGPDGQVRVVPKKHIPQMSPAEMDSFLVAEIYKNPGKTVEQLKADHPHLFQANTATSFPAWLSAAEEARRRKEIRNADKPWYQDFKWMRSTKMLLTLSKGRFKLIRDGSYQGMELPGHPGLTPPAQAPLTLGEVRERMEEGRDLLTQRKLLLAKVAEVEERMVAIGMEPEGRGTGGGGSLGVGQTLMERRAEGGRLAFKALGIATALVAAGAVVGGYAFSEYTGVKDVDGLAAFIHMRLEHLRRLKDASSTLSGQVADSLRGVRKYEGGEENSTAEAAPAGLTGAE